MFVVLLHISFTQEEALKIMSDNQTLEIKLTEVVVGLKELTTEIKHLVKGHDETRIEVKELRERIHVVENSLAGEKKLLEMIDRNQVANKRLFYSVAGAVLTIALIGGLMFKFSGGA